MNALHVRLTEIAAGLLGSDPEVAKWIQSRIRADLDRGRRKRRQRTVMLLRADGQPARGGRFRIPADVLKRAEIID